jgi:hypothetical protein
VIILKKKILLIEPPFYRLFKESYSLDRYPLSLGYLAAMVKRDSDWDVSVYNADFASSYENFSINYLKGEGYSKFKSSLENKDLKIWGEIRRTLGEYSPDIVGISAKTQNFKSAVIIASSVKEILPNAKLTHSGRRFCLPIHLLLNFKKRKANNAKNQNLRYSARFRRKGDSRRLDWLRNSFSNR